MKKLTNKTNNSFVNWTVILTRKLGNHGFQTKVKNNQKLNIDKTPVNPLLTALDVRPVLAEKVLTIAIIDDCFVVSLWYNLFCSLIFGFSGWKNMFDVNKLSVFVPPVLAIYSVTIGFSLHTAYVRLYASDG